MLRVRLTLPLFLLVAAGLGPAGAQAAVERAHQGQVQATVTYAGSREMPSHVSITIARGRRTVLTRRVSSPLCGNSCWPLRLQVLDLAGGTEPDVLLSLYTGGAHCCYLVQVYRYDSAAHTYRVAENDFGDPGAQLRRIRGRWVFLSADDRFAYEFASFAASGLPLLIERFDGRRFRDVTREYPRRIAADAAAWWKIYAKLGRGDENEGIFAAWAADQELLGHGALVEDTLAREVRARRLHGNAPGAQFARALRRFLRRQGYAR